MTKRCNAKWFLVVLAVGLFQTTNSIEEIECQTLNKNCVLVTECVSAIDLLKTNPRERTYESLRKMFCGFDARGPKVCCPIDSPIVFNNDTETATSRIKTTTTPTTTTVASTTEIVNRYGLPGRQVCGLSTTSQDKIVGGDLASLDEFPWLARIKSRAANKNDRPAVFNCGGSLISDRYVITAAHCVHKRADLGVRLGEWDIETSVDCQDGMCSDPPVDVNVTKAVVHQLYDSKSLRNDIALLLLAESVNFTDFVRPVCLPFTTFPISQDYVAGDLFWVAGWGITEYGSSSVIKRKVALDAVPLDVCGRRLPQLQSVDANNVICAGGRIGKDTCNGDSGGSLAKEVMEQGYVNWYLYGITSFGARQCGVTDTPSVYTRVTSYIDWIKDNIAS